MTTAAPIRFAEVRAWLFEQALPFWTAVGMDPVRGGAIEQLTLSGEDAAAPFRRTRVQARQIYVFSQARVLGWDGPAAKASDSCWAFLETHARRADGGYARTTDRDGGPLDSTCDAYDMAFVLFALAWRARCGDASALARAGETLDALDRILGAGVGWRAAEDNPAFIQNPHMHLLEALLELTEAGGGARFETAARGLVGLFLERMFDARDGRLPEAFDADWTPLPGDRNWYEPGHHYEWVWLLHRAKTILGVEVVAPARALFAFGERHAQPGTGLTYDALDHDLTPRPTFRAWPQTEALKANLAMFEHQGVDTRARVAEVVSLLLDRYLAVTPAGCWQDRFGPGWAPLADHVPTSSLYHLVLAFTELLRLEGNLQSS